MSRFVDIRLDQIVVGQRLRKVDTDWVAAIAVSMEQMGQQQPILIAKSGEKFRLVAGAHRGAAAKKLNWEKVAALVVDGTGLELRLHEIDENLMRRELSALDRDTFLSERHSVYLQLHPETERGKAGAASRWHASESISFASDAAEKLGLSERLIQLSIARYKKISPDVRDQIATTWIANKATELSALARCSGAAEQRKVVAAMLREKAPCASVGEARIELGLEKASKSSTDKHLSALVSAWRKAPASTKRAFITSFEREIDHLINSRSKRSAEDRT